jgi:hypothetical protein
MFFQEKVETGLNLPIRRNLENSQAALTLTPGQYKVISQGAVPKVTGNPFFFQDPLRSYLVTPKLSALDDIVADPGEIGGVIVSERAVAPSSTGAADNTLPARIASITGMPGAPLSLSNGTGAGVSIAAALGPDTHSVSPFALRSNTRYGFQTFYHPYVCALINTLNREGPEQMLSRELQLAPHQFVPGGVSATPFSFQAVYGPSTDLVAQPHPTEEMDFSFSGAYSAYNWELFFHAPLLVADRLSKNQRFEEATQWFHYIFNPTDVSGQPAPQRYWQTKEFFEKTPEDYQQERLGSLFNLLARGNELRQKTNLAPEEQKDLQRLLDLEASIKAWRDQPFKPHLVARMRTTAYQKAVVMKYIDNLIAWGDQLFRRDTLESLNEATQLYVLAADILGPRPVEIAPRFSPQVQTYNSLTERLDGFSNALVEIEDFIPVDPEPGGNIPEQQPPTLLFFCLPKNDKLLRYWDTNADRLFKIRHCMNIEGVVRQLPLFEPPIDPALLVRGVAAGLDLNSLLNDVSPVLPEYRFSVISQKASELCGELRSLGATLLATLEKRDVEELSLLRARQESALLELIEQVREKQLEEANTSLDALQKGRDLVVSRYLHYQALLGVENPKSPAVGEVVAEVATSPLAKITESEGIKLISHEATEMTLLEDANNFRFKSAQASLVATHFAPIPDESLQPMGVGAYLVLQRLPTELAHMFAAEAEVTSYRAGRSSRNAQYIMRAHDWTLQNNLAAREIMQIDKQIIAAEIRKGIAEHELRNHRRQMENAAEVEEFMRDKFTNRELYSWMLGQVSGVYFQTYQLAYETAKRAEQCFRHELGVKDSSYIQFGYWDSLKKGLMAGEKLHHDLKRLELAYLESNEREFELTKHVCLQQLNPLALLSLKATGTCEVILPEWLFDMDGPGHYMRRLKNVSVSIPSVTGPYTSTNCTLTLLKSSIRTSPLLLEGNYARQGGDDERFIDSFGANQSIVTSGGSNDGGLFETNLRDERYLPFEGAGAESTWRLELPADFRQFDYDTISDVVLHVRYTAKPGGEQLRNKAVEHLKDLVGAANASGLTLLFSLKHDFPNEWHRFVNGNENFTMTIKHDHFPYLTQGKRITINAIQVHSIQAENVQSITPQGLDLADLTATLENESAFTLSLIADNSVLIRDPQAYAFIVVNYSLGP